MGISSITPFLEWLATRADLSKSCQRKKSLRMFSAIPAMQFFRPMRRTSSTAVGALMYKGMVPKRGVLGAKGRGMLARFIGRFSGLSDLVLSMEEVSSPRKSM